MKPFALFAACLPGLEELLAGEMQERGLGGLQPEAGGVAFTGHRAAIYRANLELGLATRVLVQVGSFRVRSFPELIRKTARLEWERFLFTQEPFAVRATCRRSRLYHSGGVESRVALGILERQQETSEREAGAGAPTVRVQLVEDECRLSLDTSGPPLWQRGYKESVAKAPLREDIACALLRASGWDRESVLVDPMCGAGTLVLEAATLALNRPAGRLRDFAFTHTPLHDAASWNKVRQGAMQRARDGVGPRLLGSDRDAGAIAAATENATRAGLAGDVELTCCSISEAPGLGDAPPPRGALVTNPPYGRRVAGGDLRRLYQRLGVLAAKLPPDWAVALLAADRRLALKTGLPLETAFLTDHGGVKVRGLVRRGPGTP